jgi:hypothetical protein
MIELTNDILLFENFLDPKLCNDLNRLVDENYEEIFDRELREAKFPFEGIRGRIEVYKFPELMKQFEDFWFSQIEDQMLDYYLKWLPERNRAGAKAHARTDWKDVFVQVYNDMNTFDFDENVHCDFSGITFVSCIHDKYEGGILKFPKHNVSLKLKKRDLVIFPGLYTHPHGVTKLSGGERRVLVGQSMGVPQLHKFGKEIANR